MGALVNRWLERRKELGREWANIRQVEGDAKILVEELRRRRDGMAPRRLYVTALVAAVRETTQHAPLTTSSQFPRPDMEEIGRAGITIRHCGRLVRHRAHDWSPVGDARYRCLGGREAG